MKALSHALVLLGLLHGCGTSPEPSLSRTKANVLVPYDQWCEGWGLTCPTGDAANVPSQEHPWTKAQWKNAFAAAEAVVGSPSDVRFSRADADDAALKQALDAFGLGDLLVQVKHRIDAAGLDELKFGGGALTFSAQRESSYQAPSGLVVASQRSATLRFDPHGDVAVDGFSLRSQRGVAEPLQGFSVSDVNLMEWRASPSKKYADVPIQFFLDNILGIDLNAIHGDASTSTFLNALAPLKDWLTAGQRDLSLGGPVFPALAANVPALLSDANDRAATKYILEHLTKLESTAAMRGAALARGESSSEIKCRLNNEAIIMVDTHFALTKVERLGDKKARAQLQGVRARPLRGLIRPTIQIATLDVTPDRIIIRDVPVIGTYEIDLNDPDNKDLSVRCGEGILSNN